MDASEDSHVSACVTACRLGLISLLRIIVFLIIQSICIRYVSQLIFCIIVL